MKNGPSVGGLTEELASVLLHAVCAQADRSDLVERLRDGAVSVKPAGYRAFVTWIILVPIVAYGALPIYDRRPALRASSSA